MIRTAEAYRQGLRDGREVWMDNERVADVTKHPAFKPIIDVKARMYEMAYEPAHQNALTYIEHGARHSTFHRPPRQTTDWTDKTTAIDLVLKDIGGVVTRRAESLSEKVTIPPS